VDRDPQNISDPRKDCGSFVDETFRRYIVETLTNNASIISFPLTPNHMTLSDLASPSRGKSSNGMTEVTTDTSATTDRNDRPVAVGGIGISNIR